LLALATPAFGQTFDVASIKPSERQVGPDYNNNVTVRPTDFKGRNVTLKRLIGEAYGLAPFQIAGPKWMENDEFDVDAKSPDSSDAGQIRAMLRPLLANRFHLAAHRETKDQRVYELVVDKGGPKFHQGDPEPPKPGMDHFHGELDQFAGMLTIRLSMPIAEDPTKPSIATGVGNPVVNKTGLTGEYDLNYNAKPELGVDSFVRWQRILQEQLGLKLESRRGPVEILIIDNVQRVPDAN
jgi:uncharacterized protein (TIGR03435 family)